MQDEAIDQQITVPASGAVEWSAPEFVANDKSAGWFLGLATGAAIAAFFVYILTKDAISTGVVVVVSIIFGVYAGHKPRELAYRLDAGGISIGGKQYFYEAYKSFSVKPEGSLLSLTFMPLKRFAPPLTIYYLPGEEEKIMPILTTRLPYEEPRRDAVDSLMRRIKF